MDKRMALLDAAIKDMNIAEHHIKSFEYFIDNGLQNIVNSNSTIEPVIKPAGVTEFLIKLGKITVGKPDIREIDSTVRPIMPMEARIRDLNYDASMTLMVSYIADKKVIKEKEVVIGRMPIMLKSKYCNLFGLSKEDLIKIKEDPNDPGGYFIINGTERIIITTEDLAPNKNDIECKDHQAAQKYRLCQFI
jgi:DNA-directed RNA polymerase, beta subunit/140 kD subunit